jgi:hypothetical protein
MANINLHPAPGSHAKLPPGFLAVRGTGDIVATNGFTVPDRDMRADVTMGIGDILATQGFAVPNRDMNPLADYVSGARPMPGGSASGGCGCAGGCSSKGSLNGIHGVGDIAADFAAIQNDFTTANYMGILSAPIAGIPYAIPIALAALFILPGMFSGGGGRRRR